VREGNVRHDATMEDFRKFSMLAQSYPELDTAGGVICEPNDAPLDSRHLDMIFALQTLTDKFYMGNVVSGVNALDTIRMTEILFGGRATIEATPATISLINCNSPLRWDDRMLDAQFEYNLANQPVILTPFLLMGAMSPVTIASALAQQMADAQAGYEALMTMLPTFLTGTNMVMHAAGWLESGLVSSYEKFIIDIELLRMLRVEFTPLEIDEASLAFRAHEEVGHGG